MFVLLLLTLTFLATLPHHIGRNGSIRTLQHGTDDGFALHRAVLKSTKTEHSNFERSKPVAVHRTESEKKKKEMMGPALKLIHPRHSVLNCGKLQFYRV